jgi:hypothetical protein
MKSTNSRTALVCFLLALFPGFLAGATARVLTLDALIARSDRIVYGRVVSTRPVWDPATRTIWTHTELLVLDCPKGQAGATVVITEPGGILGEVGHVFVGVPTFSLNEEVVVFLSPQGGDRLRVTGLRQGVYPVRRDGNSGRRIVQSAVYTEHVSSSRVDAEPGASGKAPPNRLDDFLYAIRQRAR